MKCCVMSVCAVVCWHSALCPVPTMLNWSQLLWVNVMPVLLPCTASEPRYRISSKLLPTMNQCVVVELCDVRRSC